MMKLVNASRDTNLSAVHNPFPFQLAAFEALKGKEYGAAFHEQGLGKTKIAIDLALNWLFDDTVDSVIFITKKGLISNWKKEIAAHTHIKPWVLGGNSQDNFVAFNTPVRFYITHYELIRTSTKAFELFFKTRDIGVVLDEAQKIKNPNSSLAEAFYNIAPLAVRRLILTGTPIANRPQDIWALIYFLDQGKALGSSYDDFKCELDLSKKLQDKKNQRNFESALEKIRDRIADFSVRETKEGAGIDLPNKKYRSVYCEWSTVQQEMYESYKKDLKNIILKAGKISEDRVDDILKRMTRLVQTASNPALIDDNYREEPGKLQALKDCLYPILDAGEKAIIWSSFIGNVDWLTKLFSENGAVKIHGKMGIPERDKSVESFLNNEDCKILVATPASAKEGLTLTVANHVIFYDRGFSLDDYLQAQDRVHRISQTRTCYITSLLMNNSIDEWIDGLLAAKGVSAKLALGDITREEFQELADFSFFEELSRFLGIDKNTLNEDG